MQSCNACEVVRGGRVAKSPSVPIQISRIRNQSRARQGQPHGTVRSVGPVRGGPGYRWLVSPNGFESYKKSFKINTSENFLQRLCQLDSPSTCQILYYKYVVKNVKLLFYIPFYMCTIVKVILFYAQLFCKGKTLMLGLHTHCHTSYHADKP